jgi:hypothetical protein
MDIEVWRGLVGVLRLRRACAGGGFVMVGVEVRCLDGPAIFFLSGIGEDGGGVLVLVSRARCYVAELRRVHHGPACYFLT